MNAQSWLLVHLVATAVLTGVGWVVQLVVYPGFARVGRGEWAVYHAAHLRGITRVVAVPWAAQGASTVALLVAPPPGQLLFTLVLGLLAAGAVAATVLGAVPAHGRLSSGAGAPEREVATLLRANLARTLAWTVATGSAAALLG